MRCNFGIRFLLYMQRTAEGVYPVRPRQTRQPLKFFTLGVSHFPASSLRHVPHYASLSRHMHHWRRVQLPFLDILCQITSEARGVRHSVRLDTADFVTGGLSQGSRIRPSRLFTADFGIVVYRAGQVSARKSARPSFGSSASSIRAPAFSSRW